MKTLLALFIASLLVIVVSGDCAACIHGQCYRKHFISGEFFAHPGIDLNTNTYIASNFTTITSYNLDTDAYNETRNIWHAYVFFVDQRTGDVYAKTIRPRHRLCKLDSAKSNCVLVIDKELTSVTFADKLYYSTKDGIFTFEDSESYLVPGTAGMDGYFIIDNKGDLYIRIYEDDSYSVRKLEKGAINSTYFCNDTFYMTTDRDSNAIFFNTLSNAVYKVIDDQLVEIGVTSDPVSLPMFDKNNNIVYYSDQRVFHLKREKYVRCSTLNSGNQTIITELFETTENTTAESEVVSTGYKGSDAGASEIRGEDDKNTSDPEKHYLNRENEDCKSPKIPNINIKIEFN